MAPKGKPAVLVVHPSDGAPQSYDLKHDTDWAIIFEDVLEIKAADGVTTYIPLDSLTRWVVRAA